LAPPDRSAFLAALAQLLRQRTAAFGDGAVFRVAKQFLTTRRLGELGDNA
jgi:hypothetical protein